jgi:hypothetical protein
VGEAVEGGQPRAECEDDEFGLDCCNLYLGQTPFYSSTRYYYLYAR